MFKINGKKLAERRKSLGMSLLDLSIKARVYQSNISRLESGLVDPRISTIVPILKALDANLEEYVEGNKCLPAV